MTGTKSATHNNKLGIAALAFFGMVATVVLAGPASAVNGQVQVTASNDAKFSMTLSTATSNFGTNLGPDGTPSNQSDVAAYQDGNNGAYYVKSDGPGFAQTIEVKSNQAWSGSVSAAENTGSAGMKIADNSLRWSQGNMTSLNDAKSGTAFSMTPDNTVFGVGNQPAGVNTYNYDYSLRVLWTDAPGTFSSIVTYTASQ
jgi:hypothetical protein